MKDLYKEKLRVYHKKKAQDEVVKLVKYANSDDKLWKSLIDVGKFLNSARIESGLNKFLITKATGINSESIDKTETAEKNIQLLTLIRICNLYNIEVYLKNDKGEVLKINDPAELKNLSNQ